MELIYIFIIPTLAAGLSLIPTEKRNFAAVTTVMGTAVVLIISTRASLLAAGGAEIIAINGWLSCDSFDALILLLIAFTGFTASIFSWGYIEKFTDGSNPAKVRRYYAQYNLFLLSMFAVPIFSQVALIWIAVELTTLLSVFLVSFDNTAEALEAAWKYAVLTCMGAAFALFGILILYWAMNLAGGGPFTWTGLVAASPSMSPVLLKTAFIFILIGFGTKAGLVPLHTWLPDAHSQAPSPVCALLSGIETTTALYVVMRLMPVFNEEGRWLIIIGLISVGVAAFLIIQVKDYKRLFAFSTIEHMGIILVAAGLGGGAAHYGAVYQIMNHAFTKSFCFFAAGAVLMLTGTRDIASARGLVRISPITGVFLLLGGLAISGAPPFAVFLSEFTILKAGISNGQYLVVGLLAFFVVIAFCGIMYHLNRMVFGEVLKPLNAPEPILPISYSRRSPTTSPYSIVSLLVSLIPVVLLGLYMPGPLHNLLRLAAVLIGR